MVITWKYDILEVDSMVVTWWIAAFLCSVSLSCVRTSCVDLVVTKPCIYIQVDIHIHLNILYFYD